MPESLFNRYRQATPEERLDAMRSVLGRMAALEEFETNCRLISKPVLVGSKPFGAGWYEAQTQLFVENRREIINDDLRRLGGFQAKIIDHLTQEPRIVHLTGWLGVSREDSDFHVWQHTGEDSQNPVAIPIPRAYLGQFRSALDA